MSSSSPLQAECRAFLREGLPEAGLSNAGQSKAGLSKASALDSHVASCAFCSARRAAKHRLAALQTVRPPVPAALRDPAFLDRIRARIVEQCEAAPLGVALDQAMPVEVPAAVGQTFPAELLDGELPRRILPLSVGPTSATASTTAEALVWSRVRKGVMRELQQRHRHRLARGVALAGVAAAAILATMLGTEGTRQAPAIVILDVTTMPAVDFSPMAVIRHGANH